MKHAALRAIVHNIADSLGSGCSLMTGADELDVFADATMSAGKPLKLDIKNGAILEGQCSPPLEKILPRLPSILEEACLAAGGSSEDLVAAEVTYKRLVIFKGFTVYIEDRAGKRSSMDYVGTPGRRVTILDALGRRRKAGPNVSV